MTADEPAGRLRSPKLRRVTSILLTPLPSSVKIVLGRNLLGWRIHPTARIGFSLIEADSFSMSAHSRIGHLTVCKKLSYLAIGDNAVIDHWNWISASPAFRSSHDSACGLELGRHSAITLRHYIDCSGGVRIGAFTTVAGVKSTILSHQIDIATSKQTAVPVEIGNYCFIGSDVRLAPGARIQDKTVVGMGAVVAGTLTETEALYAGVPARFVKSLSGAKYFTRERGFVWID